MNTIFEFYGFTLKNMNCQLLFTNYTIMYVRVYIYILDTAV